MVNDGKIVGQERYFQVILALSHDLHVTSRTSGQSFPCEELFKFGKFLTYMIKI